jgi:hypothetical protein
MASNIVIATEPHFAHPEWCNWLWLTWADEYLLTVLADKGLLSGAPVRGIQAAATIKGLTAKD